MPFSSLLIHRCSIESKTLSTSGYEQKESWSVIGTDIACRHDNSSSVSIEDSELRKNENDDIFFFDPNVNVSRGDRISFEGNYYDVINVNKMADSSAYHHIEAEARLVNNK